MTSKPTQQTKTLSWDQQNNDQRLLSLQQLIELQATDQYLDILAGSKDAGIETTQLLEIIRTLDPKTIKQVALITRSRTIAEALVALHGENADLLDLCLFARSVVTRKNAALTINDVSLLKELRAKVKDKDKTVFKVVDQRLAASNKIPDTASTDMESTDTKNTDPKKIAKKNKIKESTSKQSKSNKETQPAFPALSEESAEETPVPKTSTAKKPKAARSSKRVAEIPPEKVNPEKDIPLLEAEIEKLSFKNTARLATFRNTLNRIRKQLDSSATDLTARAQALHEAISQRMEKNLAHQEQLKLSTESLLESLKQALEAGQSHDALPAWDKIQGNISNTSGKIRAELQSQANQYKAKLNEFRDWKIFAATEKKKTLIQQMQHLIESRMHASDRSRHIAAMHKEWKSLGRSSQNETLWREFNQFSDKAYEPCKAYFKERKQVMAGNLQKRREICESLEQELEKLKKDTINIAQVNNLLSTAESDWKKFAPVEQSKIKVVQKRYYAVVNQVRRLRKDSLAVNAKEKQGLINQAEQLAALDDRQQAMSEAKLLQKTWKKLGPTSYKEDKKYWDDFRGACDKIFAERNQEVAAFKQEQKNADEVLNNTLQSLEAVLTLEDDAFRGARGEVQDLVQKFSDALNPKVRKQRSQVIDNFNGIKHKIDARYRTLPDKKRQQLKNAIHEKASFIENLEHQLLNCANQQQFSELKSNLDSSDFEAIAPSGKPEYEQTLQSRLELLLEADSLEALQKLAQQKEQQARVLCIELEIRANIETPAEDQSLRMQIQLDQLKNGFGQMKPDRKENARYALDAELQGLCIGPLETAAQQQLSQRLNQAVKKLL
ncbi:MAG: DUF349 domain-containing protein [Proteobacteria bacterium]|nr:DUF349 domain-containing protein [Pseudomonadota bacterium]